MVFLVTTVGGDPTTSTNGFEKETSVGFFGSLLKIGAGIAGTIVGGPAGGIAAYTAVSKVTGGSPPVVQPPPYIAPPAPVQPPPNWSPVYTGGAGGGPVNSFSPVGSPAKTKIVYRQAKKKTVVHKLAKRSKRAARKPKFGSAAYRKKYLGHKK